MADTIPQSGYKKLVFEPPAAYAGVASDKLGSMKFDTMHYLRAYNQCRGRGNSRGLGRARRGSAANLDAPRKARSVSRWVGRRCGYGFMAW